MMFSLVMILWHRLEMGQRLHSQRYDMPVVNIWEDAERHKLELQRREEELKTLNEKAQLNQLQVQIGRLEIELSAKDNDIKRLEDNLVYLRYYILS